MELRVREAAARRRRYFRLVLLALALVLLGSALFSFWVGYYPLTPDEVAKAFLSRFGWEGELSAQAVTISGRSVCPGFCRPSSSALLCRWRVPPTRECSAILWCPRTS